MPSAVSRSNDTTWLPKLPALWWFLPWMSEPMAPPIVTWRVPGRTGTHRPERQSSLHQLIQIHTGVDVHQGGVAIDAMNAAECIHVDDQPTGILRRVAVRAAEAARDDTASQMRWLGIVLFRNLGDRVGDHFHVGGGQHLCGGWRRCVPNR